MREGVVGLGLIILALGANLWLARRRFYRRNVAGLETFSTFTAALATRVLERLVRLLAWLAGGLGVLLLVSAALQTFVPRG